MEEFRIPINKLIYESLEDILESKIKYLVADIAKTLDVDPKILITELKKEKIYTYLIEEDYVDIDNMKCKFYDLRGNIYIPCEEPVIFKKDHCVTHINYGISKNQIPNDTLLLRVLLYQKNKFYRDKLNRVFDSSFKPIGYFNEETHILYEFEINNT
jgi:hypothetical protein